MTSKFKSVLVAVIIILIVIEFGYQYNSYNSQAREESPLDEDGKIKDGRTVSFEEEKKLATKSFPQVGDREYAETMLYSFSQCLLAAEALPDTSYTCLANNVNESLISSTIKDKKEIGKKVYQMFAKDEVVTGVDIEPSSTDEYENGQLAFNMVVNFNYDSKELLYKVIVENKKIISIEIGEK